MRPPLPPTTVIALLLAMAVLVLVAGVPAEAAPAIGDEGGQVVRGGGVRPVPGPVVRHFDPPPGPYAAGHRGADLAARAGDPVVAALGGTVVFSGQVAGIGWITVDHGGGLVTTYGPLEHRRGQGTRVTAGAVVGRLAGGDPEPSATVDAPALPGAAPGGVPAARQHLDWGARLHGEYIDPLVLLDRWQLRLTARTAGLAEGES